jgi:RNA polymerase sigma factor (TIGR02999 family)
LNPLPGAAHNRGVVCRAEAQVTDQRAQPDPPQRAEHVTALLEKARAGDELAASRLMPLVYQELRRLAGGYMRRERPGQTIQATALVHEAYLRLLKDKRQPWQNRAHFLAIAATSMRQILVERARARQSLKRGAEHARITLDEGAIAGAGQSVDLVALDQALERLAVLDAQRARIVELRFFGGLTVEETAEAVGVSPATVKRGWSIAKAWLRRELDKSI